MFALKRVNPFFLNEWRQDEKLGATDHRRRQELHKLANSIDRYSAAEQAKWMVHLEQIMTNDPSPEMRHLAVRAAGKVAGDDAFQLVEQGLDDQNLKVRMAACAALEGRPEPAAVILLAKTAGESVDLDFRQAAIRALRGHEGQQVNDALKLALRDSDPALRYAAIDSLKQVTGKDLGNRPDLWVAYLDGEPVDEDAGGFSLGELF